jgi:hypothetical protein
MEEASDMEWSKTPLTPAEAISRIEHLPAFLGPVVDAFRAAVPKGAWLDNDSGTLLAGTRLDLGIIHTHEVFIFPPLSDSKLKNYQELHDFPLSNKIVEILRYLNGCQVRDLKIYGAPASMAEDPPLLNRSLLSPLDISSGRYWRSNYALADGKDQLFASKNVGDTGQIGYFIGPSGQVVGRGNGSHFVNDQSGPWPNIAEWLASEIG